ncbi:MAG: YHYH protein [Saprospiraceae bacterium]|nr:YHYH protein [Saprospiraceae bacterium]
MPKHFSKSLKELRFLLSANMLMLLFLGTGGNAVFGQTDPAVASWIVNYAGQTGFAGIPTNVQQVQYSVNNVYISTNNIADWIPIGYDWPNNPWFPESQNFVFKITRHPEENTGNKIQTPYGHIGLWTNGVSIYNPKDAKSWQEENVWFQNAFYFEHLAMETFDPCLGHPNNMHEYHLHVNPTCLYDDTDSSAHAPLIGFAFDGFPIYGAYAYKNTDGSGPITRMQSSYRLRNITDRTTLPNGTALAADQHGPALVIYPLGAYVEDYEYVPGLGDLDEWNGRFCVTPEYPSGTYAYFVTIDAAQTPVYPYVLGPKFFGKVQPGNTGPNSGHNTISEPVVVYTSVNEQLNQIDFDLYPNPASEFFNFYVAPSFHQNMTASLHDANGRVVLQMDYVQTGVNYPINIKDLDPGFYLFRIATTTGLAWKKIIVERR